MKRATATILAVLELNAGAAAQTVREGRPSVPDLNARAINLVKPAFPSTALALDGDGSTLTVKVIVDEAGNVKSATCSTTCHPLLKEPAESAAVATKFAPLILQGRSVEYEGILMYSFVVEKVYWSRFGGALESVRQFDNISAGPVAQMLPPAFATEKAKLLSVDQKGTELETRWKVIRELEASIKTKLTGIDLWRFETSMALRRITIWPQAMERIDRDQLRSSLVRLGQFVESAPSGVSPELLKGLSNVSKYTFAPELGERELRSDINNLTRAIRLE